MSNQELLLNKCSVLLSNAAPLAWSTGYYVENAHKWQNEAKNLIEEIAASRNFMEEDNRSPEEKHKDDHIRLHKAFDELIADYIAHTHRVPSVATIMDLMKWSFSQTSNPTPDKE